MPFLVTAFQPGALDLAPPTREAEILQNVAVILSTPQCSAPLDRALGMPQRFLDRPMQVAQALLVGEVMDAIARSEPRVEVLRVDCAAGERPGLFVPVVEVKLKDG